MRTLMIKRFIPKTDIPESVAYTVFAGLVCAILLPLISLISWYVNKRKPELRVVCRWSALLAVLAFLLCAAGLSLTGLVWGRATIDDLPELFLYFAFPGLVLGVLTYLGAYTLGAAYVSLRR